MSSNKSLERDDDKNVGGVCLHLAVKCRSSHHFAFINVSYDVKMSNMLVSLYLNAKHNASKLMTGSHLSLNIWQGNTV